MKDGNTNDTSILRRVERVLAQTRLDSATFPRPKQGQRPSLGGRTRWGIALRWASPPKEPGRKPLEIEGLSAQFCLLWFLQPQLGIFGTVWGMWAVVLLLIYLRLADIALLHQGKARTAVQISSANLSPMHVGASQTQSH